MDIKNASPSLYNEDLAPAKVRNWGPFSIFNVWTSDVHSLWGYYLAASLFLLCGSFVNFILAIGIGSLVIYFLMSLVGNAGVQDRRALSGPRPRLVRRLGRQHSRRWCARSSPASGMARRPRPPPARSSRY